MQTEHRGHVIRYSENEDKWRCHDIEFAHAQLSKVKAKIDTMYRDLRKAAATDVAILGYDGSITYGQAVEYIGERKKKSGAWALKAGEDKFETVHKVGVWAITGGGDRPSKRMWELHNLVVPGPEVEAVIDRVKEMRAQMKELDRQARELVAAVPRLTLDDIADLVKAGETKFEEGDS